jgi:hypothetical protein
LEQPLSGRTILNEGTIDFQPGQGVADTITVSNSGWIINDGDLAPTQNGVFTIRGDDTSLFTNRFMISTGNGITLNFDLPFVASDDADFQFADTAPAVGAAGAIVNLSTAEISKSSAQGFGVLGVSGRLTLDNDGLDLTNAQRVAVALTGATVDGTTPLVVPTDCILGISGMTLEGNTIDVRGPANWASGDIYLNQGVFFNSGTFAITGNAAMTMWGSGIFENLADPDSPGTIEVNRTAPVTIDPSSWHLAFVNTGIINLNAGTLAFARDWTQDAGGRINFGGGGVQVKGNFTLEGTVSMAAAVGGISAMSVINDGVIRLVDFGAVARLWILALPDGSGGNYTQTPATATSPGGRLLVRLYDDQSSDALAVRGSATLGGDFIVSFSPFFAGLGGMDPVTWNPIWFIGFARGRFNDVTLPDPPAGLFQQPGYYQEGALVLTWRPN